MASRAAQISLRYGAELLEACNGRSPLDGETLAQLARQVARLQAVAYIDVTTPAPPADQSRLTEALIKAAARYLACRGGEHVLAELDELLSTLGNHIAHETARRILATLARDAKEGNDSRRGLATRT
jgi:hypothetical protein